MDLNHDIIFYSRDGYPPWEHQLTATELSAEREAFALFMEQRTGKTRVALATAAHLYLLGAIDAICIIAPNGVHLNWVLDELPAWLHHTLRYRAHTWRSGTSLQTNQEEERTELLAHKGLAVLAVNIEAVRTDRCFVYIRKFLHKRRAMLIVDESQVIKTAGAKQTKRVRALGNHAPYRRILTGTPATESPFDLFTQFSFLDNAIFGCPTFALFKRRYGIWTEGYNRATGHNYPQLEEYQNLEDLTNRIAPHTFRFRRDQFGDRPEKIYMKVRFDLDEEQRKVYNNLREEYVAELSDGRGVRASHVLTRMIRLQQVISNMWPSEETIILHEPCDGEGCESCGYLGVMETTLPPTPISKADPHPLLAAALQAIEEEPGQIVVWARFRNDITELVAALQERGERVVRYDGAVKAKDRAEARVAFQRGDYRIAVANTAVGGRGVDFSAADHLMYYSHAHSLEQRLQSEDRAEALHKNEATTVTDFVANDTVVDTSIVPALRNKESLSRMIMGDPERIWL